MDLTHDELLAKISDLCDNCLGLMAGATLSHALRAVVELHKPCEPVSDDNFVTCLTCNYEYHREYPWPCETIQAIVKSFDE